MAQAQGATITWTSSGGDYVITLTSLADGDGRMGAEHDWGVANIPEKVLVEVQIDPNVAPTAGKTFQYYVAESSDGTNYPGEVTGSDGAYNNEADAARLTGIGAIAASNDTDPHRASFIFFPSARYIVPVAMNALGQALTSTGTDQWIKMTPIA